MADLIGKVALVTGGSRGIGAAIAKRLAREGADVALTYVSSAKGASAVVAAIEANGRRALAIAADSADPQAVAAAVERTVAEFGRIDILVNNAGIFPYEPLEAVTLDSFDRTMAIHVRAAFVAAQAAARHMGTGGRIINIGSCLADRTGGPNMTVYAASKAALTGLSKGLAQDLGPRGITANVVHPGPTDTDMNPAQAEGADLQRQGLPLGRFGDADDVAATVAHLAGQGGRFITGAAIAVDGGFAA
ncbi:3-oxoacyl-ACP reductase FabG [Luteimonas sp. SJ-92]|uniref:3-oxoacyl-ACP reductase FabG n=1 Tax=Luteimonas salinisoli TaxID=2752307 RepID=A0A853JD09_9GAMM|nr:3-oxoacyl-ACP reductase family protein [Luteimonas salinisoli]NZA27176.1 3-oxoacyl-ACP reductase FabG [Luteimonas salinisoli]